MRWEIWKAKMRANLIMARLDLKALSKRVDVYDVLIYSYMAFCIYIVMVSV